jgi:hypothetical protein
MEGETKPAAAENAVILPAGLSYQVYRCVDSSTIVERSVVVATPPAVTWELTIPGTLPIQRIIATFNSGAIGRAIANFHRVDDADRRRNPDVME